MDFAVCYVVTPDKRFHLMADESIRSLCRHHLGIQVFIKEQDGGDYPIGIKHHALQAFRMEPVVKWLLFLDADTRVIAPLDSLEPPEGIRFCGRHETMWRRGVIRHEVWRETCEAARVPFVPVFNSGAFLILACEAQSIGAAWAAWMKWLKANAEDPLRPGEAKRRYKWWMLEQCALSLAVSQLPRVEWGRQQHSYHWCGEHGKFFGLIHHFGSKRWEKFVRGNPGL